MSKHETVHSEKHPKQDFQVERIAFFSDAVFAIALTLLIIEFRPPHITKDSTYAEIWHDLVHMKFKLASLVFSFALIINYWIKHHTLFKHIHNYNNDVLKANMWILLPVIFFPFSTSFLYEVLEVSDSNLDLLTLPFRVFILNNMLAAAATYYFYYVVMKKNRAFAYPWDSFEEKLFAEQLLLFTVCFTVVFLLSFVTMEYCSLGLLPIVAFRYRRRALLQKQKTKLSHAK